MRFRDRTSSWICIVSSVALVVSVLSSPIRTPPTLESQIGQKFLRRNFALVSGGRGMALTSATLGRTSVDADDAELEEEDEDQSSGSFSEPIRADFIPSNVPAHLFSESRPGLSPPRTAGVPLRC